MIDDYLSLPAYLHFKPYATKANRLDNQNKKDMKHTLKLAIALDKNLQLPESHFGESENFLIYGLSGDKLHFLKSIPNLHKKDDEDTNHGDPVKGNNIANLLKKENVNILVSKSFGENIKIVSKFFLPVIVPMTDVKNVVILLENSVSNLTNATTKHFKDLKSKAYKLK
jgi:predicted Fe-Mo cluster-binding NifX family protein